MNQVLGEIRMFAGRSAPRGWELCNGQSLAISQHAALFQIIGVTYGGDGRTTFELPDLRGRAPIHAGEGRGLSNRPLGQKGGSEQTTRQTVQAYRNPEHSSVVVLAGNSPSANNMQPYLAVNYIIAVQGIMPPEHND